MKITPVRFCALLIGIACVFTFGALTPGCKAATAPVPAMTLQYPTPAPLPANGVWQESIGYDCVNGDLSLISVNVEIDRDFPAFSQYGYLGMTVGDLSCQSLDPTGTIEPIFGFDSLQAAEYSGANIAGMEVSLAAPSLTSPSSPIAAHPVFQWISYAPKATSTLKCTLTIPPNYAASNVSSECGAFAFKPQITATTVTVWFAEPGRDPADINPNFTEREFSFSMVPT